MPDDPESEQPSVVKTILCLASSRKAGGRCIVGQDVEDLGTWIRPISVREHEEVSWEERHYEDGGEPQVLDVIEVPLIGPQPHLFQQENWLLDPNFYWQKTDHVDWVTLLDLVEPEEQLWINGQSSGTGINNRIAENQANHLQSSLRLIRVDALELEVYRPGEAFGRRKKRLDAEFDHAGTHYRLRVTDAVYERHYRALGEGNYTIGECCLTISLGETYQGYAYKLVAAIIERAETEE